MPTTPEPNEAHLTAAVQRCCQEYHRVLAIPRPPDGKGSSKCFAKEAYRQAMPFLTSPDNIDAFIACVAQGMLLGAIDPDDASKLLYAAQVAIGSRRARLQTARFNSTNTANSADSASNTPTPSPIPDQPPAGAPGPSHLGTWDVTTSATLPEPKRETPTPIAQTPNPTPKKPVASQVPDPEGLIHHAEQCLARCLEKPPL